jgi:hypothetical protein
MIVSAIVFVGWVVLIGEFVGRHRTWRPVLRRQRHGSGEAALTHDQPVSSHISSVSVRDE